MIIKESDLFRELNDQSLVEISRIMVEESREKNDIIYTIKDRATDFYILFEGRIRLSFGKEGEIDYTVNKRGEVFGWSSMVGRGFYTATAECVSPSKIMKINADKLNGIFKKDPAAGVIFFRQLAAAVVQRLIDTYGAFLTEGSLRGVTSQGSRQIASEDED